MLEVAVNRARWQCAGDVWAIGYAYTDEGEFVSGGALAKLFMTKTEEELVRRLAECNGQFSVIVSNEMISLAAVSPSRLYPLYYRIAGERLMVSDNPYSLYQNGDKESEEAVWEYDASGAPFSGKTLVRDVLQISPGHYLRENGAQVAYFHYEVKYKDLRTPTYEETRKTVEDVFARIIQSCEGRQVVVPLSGGNDSRFILCMLRKAGYENVLCYTVGRLDSKECETAENVAKQLHYPIYHIDPTQAECLAMIHISKTSFTDYVRYVGNWGNWVWLFEYVALRWLQNRGLLSQNAIFIPGHSADSSAGSHLQKACVSENCQVEEMVSDILYDSFEYGHKNVKQQVERYLQGHLKKDVTPWSVYQAFIFENRQAHNILNSSRVYIYFGYDIRLPYWDRKFLDIFRYLPYEGLRDCSFYRDFIRRYTFVPMGVDYAVPCGKRCVSYYFVQKIKNRLKGLLPKSIVMRCRQKANDELGERALAEPLWKELIREGLYMHRYESVSANEIMKDWYLMFVRKELKEKSACSVPKQEVVPSLKAYIEGQIIPMYDDFDQGHSREHVRSVIRQSEELAQHYDVKADMVYAIAAYHDTGLREDRATHHIVSGKIVREDANLRQWFSEEEIEIMAEAAEDHRASNEKEPRSIYGKIVAEADRQIDADTIIRRTIQYGFAHYPTLSEEEHIKRTIEHLRNKYGRTGYLCLWLPESPNVQRLEDLRNLIDDEAMLRHKVSAVYKEISKE
ncbi:MAG TPA: hypothetical protein DIW30_00385 [Bacteroidales bacterium]|nr:hypothetical protein [Bacteroidales bacterium]